MLEFNQLHLEVGWCIFHVSCKWIAKQLKPAFFGFKGGKSPCEVSTSYAKFFRKLWTWAHGGRDLLFHSVAVWGNGSRLSQVQLGFKSPQGSIHVCDHMASALKLQVERIEVVRDVTNKHHFTPQLFIPELCCVFPFAFYELTDQLTQLGTSFQYFSLA